MENSAEAVRVFRLPDSAGTPTTIRGRFSISSGGSNSGKKRTRGSLAAAEDDPGIERLVPAETAGTPIGHGASSGIEIDNSIGGQRAGSTAAPQQLSASNGSVEIITVGAVAESATSDNESDSEKTDNLDAANGADNLRPVEVRQQQQQQRQRTVPSSPPRPSLFLKGHVVEVMPRLWPGMNKQGGTARVTGVHYTSGARNALLFIFKFMCPDVVLLSFDINITVDDTAVDDDMFRYDVAYIVDMGKKERRVEEKFIKLNKDLTTLLTTKPSGAAEDGSAAEATAAAIAAAAVVQAAAHQRNTQGRCK